MKNLTRIVKVVLLLVAVLFMNVNAFGELWFAIIDNSDDDNRLVKEWGINEVIKINDNHKLIITGQHIFEHIASKKCIQPGMYMRVTGNAPSKITEVINYTDENGKPAVEINVFQSKEGTYYDDKGIFPGPGAGTIYFKNKRFAATSSLRQDLNYIQGNPWPGVDGKNCYYSSFKENGLCQVCKTPASARSAFRCIIIRRNIRYGYLTPYGGTFIEKPDWNNLIINVDDKRGAAVLYAEIIVYYIDSNDKLVQKKISSIGLQTWWTYNEDDTNYYGDFMTN